MEPERLLSGSSIICIGTLLMVPQLSVLSLALCHEALEGGGNHKTENQHHKKETYGDYRMETSIAKRNFCSHQYLVTNILNAHITKKFEKTYRIINLRRYSPQSANETRKCAGTPIPYTTNGS